MAFGTEVYLSDAGGTMLEPHSTEIPPQQSDNARIAIRITPKPMIAVKSAIREGAQRIKPFPSFPAGYPRMATAKCLIVTVRRLMTAVFGGGFCAILVLRLVLASHGHSIKIFRRPVATFG